ncbi:leucine-rich repeat protein [Skeletonema marinoi]|uniref:Leucine-rich repeat protein n=1 Tax=Skeletonema marinoi TaxID=267567 RepID=A0AAD9DGA1_9STRA|nr:leucine-rich repeat protein [Skeletonema marinoi]
MVPFLQNAKNLTDLNLDDNHIASDGYSLIFRALRNSPIERLNCNNCGIESMEIDNNHIPKHLTGLCLNRNKINAYGCRGLAKLLQREGATLINLWLNSSKINDDGVEILVDALQNNKSLKSLNLMWNDISDQGKISLLKLVIDISSITATLHSNHTLEHLNVNYTYSHEIQPDDEIEQHIDMAIQINKFHQLCNPEAAGRRKVIKSHLHSETREKLCRLQGVNRSHYSEIDPLYIPEVLALINQNLHWSELYVALKSSIMILFSTVSRKKCIQQQREYHVAHIDLLRAKVEELDAELAAIEASEGGYVVNVGSESRSIKRRRA